MTIQTYLSNITTLYKTVNAREHSYRVRVAAGEFDDTTPQPSP